MSKQELREIPKLPDMPVLNYRVIDLLTQLCFRKDNDINGQPVDAIFVFGIPELFAAAAAKAVLEAVTKSKSDLLVLTGGHPTYCDSFFVQRPESEVFYDYIKGKLPGNISVQLEITSNNTLENVTHSLPWLINCHKIIFVTKNFASGRNYLTMKKFLPNALLLQISFNVFYPGGNEITRDNWYSFEDSRKRVWGEFLRIKTYGQRGDIEYDEVANLIKEINENIA